MLPPLLVKPWFFAVSLYLTWDVGEVQQVLIRVGLRGQSEAGKGRAESSSLVQVVLWTDFHTNHSLVAEILDAHSSGVTKYSLYPKAMDQTGLVGALESVQLNS